MSRSRPSSSPAARSWIRAALLLIVVGVAGAACEPPRSAKPIGTPAALDERLIGVWSARLPGGSDALLEIAPHVGGADLLLVGTDESGLIPMHFDLTPGEASGVHYWNLREKRMAGDFSEKFELGANYLFVKYQLGKSGALTIWYMDDEPVKKAIEAGTLAGTTGPDFVRITDEPAKILAMAEASDRTQLWSKLGTFHRAKITFPRNPPR